MINNLTINQAVDLLHVTGRTVRLWESGDSRIPYSAFKLLRLLANGELISEDWKGWRVRGDTLYTPSGRAFKQHEFAYLSHYMTMARYWLEQRKPNLARWQLANGGQRLRLVAGRSCASDLTIKKGEK